MTNCTMTCIGPKPHAGPQIPSVPPASQAPRAGCPSASCTNFPLAIVVLPGLTVPYPWHVVPFPGSLCAARLTGSTPGFWLFFLLADVDPPAHCGIWIWY